MNTYSRHYTIDHYLNKVRQHTEPYLETILGKEIIIFPNVMSPKYDRSSKLMLSMMPDQKSKHILDVGSGSGILSLFSVLQGAEQVTAIDINPHAVKNTQENFKKYELANSRVLLSDLFDQVEGAFDTIIFNAPFHGNKANDLLELGTSDLDYQTLRRFFTSAKKFLKPEGEILLGFANTGDNQLVKELIKTHGYTLKDFLEKENGDWTMYLYILTK